MDSRLTTSLRLSSICCTDSAPFANFSSASHHTQPAARAPPATLTGQHLAWLFPKFTSGSLQPRDPSPCNNIWISSINLFCCQMPQKPEKKKKRKKKEKGEKKKKERSCADDRIQFADFSNDCLQSISKSFPKSLPFLCLGTHSPCSEPRPVCLREPAKCVSVPDPSPNRLASRTGF